LLEQIILLPVLVLVVAAC